MHSSEKMENAERRCERSEQNYNELKSMLLAMQGVGSQGVGSVGANNGAGYVGADKGARFVGADNEAGSAATDSGTQSAGADNGARVVDVDKGVESIGSDKGLASSIGNKRGQFVGVDKIVVAANRHKQGALIHQDVQNKAIANGQQLPSSSSDNGLHVNEVTTTRMRKFGQKQNDGDGKEVALRSLTGSKIVAYGRLRCTNKKAKGLDGLPLGEYYEVLVDTVLDSNVLLPRVQGQATKLGAAVGCCIAWPFQNVVQRDVSYLNMSKRATDF